MDFDFTTETITPDTTNILTIGGTGGLELPVGTTAERPVSPIDGTIRYNTDLSIIEGFSNSSWMSAVTTSLSQLTAATTANSINSGDFAQTWNWSLTTAAKSAFLFTENAASTNGVGSQYLLDIGTISASTANPIRVRARGIDIFNVTSAGAVTLTGATASTGQPITLSSGDSSGANTSGPAVTIIAGQGLGSGTGGAVSVSAGASVGGNGPGGPITVTGGAGGGSGAGGAITITGGSVPSGNAAGGAVNVLGGTGNGSGAGGAVIVAAGNSPGGNSNGAVASLTAGEASGSGTGGTVTVSAGNAVGTGNAGAVVINSGTPANGNGGAISITATTGVGTNKSGGDLTFTAGDGTGSGTAGSINLVIPATGTLKISGSAGSAGQVITSNGSSLAPTWQTPSTGVSTFSAGTTGFTPSSPTSGAITLAGILLPASGGTGVNTSTAANGQLLIGNGTGLTLSTLTAGTAISVTNGPGSITIANTGVTSAVGTAGNITVSAATGAVTFNLATAGTAVSNQFVKITTDAFGRVTATTAVAAGDITPLIDATYVNVAGDTMTGTLVMSGGSTQITLPNAPVAGTDATNKNYVDALVAGLSWKQAVRAATTVNGALATAYENGDTIDGVVLATGNRILIKNQTTATENGIYIVQATGAPVRSTDADTGAELVGASVYVDQGTANANTGWTQTTDAPITIGSSNIVWAQFSGTGSYTAGTGLTLTGNSFSLTAPVTAVLGGTGQTVYAVGDILYANTTTTLARLADIATGNSLISGGVGVAPSWGKIGLTTHVSGILPVANGGTALSTTPTNGQLLIGNGTNYTLAGITAGTAISVTIGAGSITVNNTGVTSLAGTANQVAVSAATGAVTLSTPATFIAPGSIASTSTITAGTTLTVTGNTANSFLYSGTAGLVTTTAAPTNGQILIGSTGVAPVASTITAGSGISVTNGAGTITIAATGGTGTVTSVGLALPSFITVSGSPVTASGTLTGTLATQTANTVFAGPVSGGAAAPTFRTLVYSDVTSAIQLYRENPSSPTIPTASGANSVAIGSGAASSAANAVAIGAGTAANVDNIFAYANGNFATAGDAQDIKVMLRNTTANATPTELFINGSSQRLAMPNNSAWTFTIRVVGRRTDATGGWAMYTFGGGSKRDATAATTTLESSSRTIIDESSGALNCTIAADTTNGSINITVTGIAAQTFRWVATAEITQVTN